MLHKLFNFKDFAIDLQIQAIVDAFNKPDLPVYADNAAALAGGLKVGREYMKPTGERMIVVAGS